MILCSLSTQICLPQKCLSVAFSIVLAFTLMLLHLAYGSLL